MIKIKGASVSVAAWCLVVVAVAVLVAEVYETAEVTCNPVDLRSCLPAITGTQPPSKECCGKLKEQVPSCYCAYIKDPALKPYIGSPTAKKVAEGCGLAIPTC